MQLKDLKGIHKTSKKLADGTKRHYYYAWKGKGAPLLKGEYGSKEFIASYLEVVEVHIKSPVKRTTLGFLIREYETSNKFKQLAPRTRADYTKILNVIEKEFSEFPLSASDNPKTRVIFHKWREKLSGRSARQADYHFAVLSAVFAFGFKAGYVAKNPCENMGSLYKSNRREKIWGEEQEVAFLSSAPRHLHLPFMLALYTAQRQGDLLKLTWTAYDGEFIRLAQGKTRKKLAIKVLSNLKPYLDEAKNRKGRGLYILETTGNTRWTSDGFSASWRKAVQAAGIDGLTFHDLRGSAITRFYNAGMAIEQIAAISGHSINEIKTTLEQNYLGDTTNAGVEGINRFEEHLKNKAPNQAPNRSTFA